MRFVYAFPGKEYGIEADAGGDDHVIDSAEHGGKAPVLQHRHFRHRKIHCQNEDQQYAHQDPRQNAQIISA